jgi:hypothetical protein
LRNEFALRSNRFQYRTSVWISDGCGIIARTEDERWFAYPFGPGELGPYASFAEAEQALVNACANKEGS